MTWDLTNIPNPNEAAIECDPILDEDENLIGFHLHAGGWTMTRIVGKTFAGMAHDIADIATGCRNRGINMGKEQVRKALGIK